MYIIVRLILGTGIMYFSPLRFGDGVTNGSHNGAANRVKLKKSIQKCPSKKMPTVGNFGNKHLNQLQLIMDKTPGVALGVIKISSSSAHYNLNIISIKILNHYLYLY